MKFTKLISAPWNEHETWPKAQRFTARGLLPLPSLWLLASILVCALLLDPALRFLWGSDKWNQLKTWRYWGWNGIIAQWWGRHASWSAGIESSMMTEACLADFLNLARFCSFTPGTPRGNFSAIYPENSNLVHMHFLCWVLFSKHSFKLFFSCFGTDDVRLSS